MPKMAPLTSTDRGPGRRLIGTGSRAVHASMSPTRKIAAAPRWTSVRWIRTARALPAGGWSRAGTRHEPHSCRRRLLPAESKLTKRYSLTADQKTKIQPILLEQQQQVHALGEDDALSDTEWAGAVRKVHTQTVAKVKLELTDAQATKYAKDEAKRAKSNGDSDNGDDGPPDGPPPDRSEEHTSE